jgi:NAD(P)-dependent dehydrogenase (short-subunit alcohol dehydrogenase family)
MPGFSASGVAGEGRRQRPPLRRFGWPSEIGDAVGRLGSDLSSFVSGVSLQVDGRLLAAV